MKPASYWNKRMEILEQSRYDGNVQSYHEIENIYRKQMAEMQKEINAWYARFAKNNEIDLADARKLLDAKELEELKWNVEDYIKYGTENALDPKWIKQLENASARYHISRLEALQLQIQQRAESVMAAEQDIVDQRVREVYSENYYHTAFEIQRGIGVGWDLERLDERRIDNVISKPWAVDGKNFSERIWEQRDKLVNTLHQELTQSIIRGEDPERAVKTLAERMSVSQSNARRLIMTESAAMASAAQKECYKELDVEQYKIVATLDDLTCDVCAGLDGQVFKMSEYNVGTTAPPFHPNCRTVTVPYFADDTSSKRAARGADGKTYLVPANTTYKEWKGAFVDGEEKPFKGDPDWKPKEPEPQPEPIRFTNINGVPIAFDKSMNQPKMAESKRVLEELCGEYNSRITSVRVATKEDSKEMDGAGGDVDFSGLMRLASPQPVTAIHEFAHSFTISHYAKKGMYDEKTEEFWKEMRKTFREYKKDYRFNHQVSISFYSFDNVDEFMAEAFTVYKSNQLGVKLTEEYNVNEHSMKYVNRVGAIIDKYFRKPENEILKPKNIQALKNKNLNVPNIFDILFKKEDPENEEKYKEFLNVCKANGIYVDSNVKGLNIQSVAETYAGVQEVAKDYPELNFSLKTIRASNNTQGVAETNGSVLTFNKKDFSNRDSLLNMCEEESKNGFWIKNSSPKSIGVHEAAHLIERLLIRLNPEYSTPEDVKIAWNNSLEARRIVIKAIKNVQQTQYGKRKDEAQLLFNISVYAAHDMSDAMAEAFADCFANRNTANPLSKEIKRLTKERYEELKRKGGN